MTHGQLALTARLLGVSVWLRKEAAAPLVRTRSPRVPTVPLSEPIAWRPGHVAALSAITRTLWRITRLLWAISLVPSVQTALPWGPTQSQWGREAVLLAITLWLLPHMRRRSVLSLRPAVLRALLQVLGHTPAGSDPPRSGSTRQRLALLQ